MHLLPRNNMPPKGTILANNMLVSIGYHTGTIQYDNLTVGRMHYASYRDIGICLNIIGRWPSWNYLVKVAMKGFNRIITHLDNTSSILVHLGHDLRRNLHFHYIVGGHLGITSS